MAWEEIQHLSNAFCDSGYYTNSITGISDNYALYMDFWLMWDKDSGAIRVDAEIDDTSIPSNWNQTGVAEVPGRWWIELAMPYNTNKGKSGSIP